MININVLLHLIWQIWQLESDVNDQSILSNVWCRWWENVVRWDISCSICQTGCSVSVLIIFLHQKRVFNLISVVMWTWASSSETCRRCEPIRSEMLNWCLLKETISWQTDRQVQWYRCLSETVWLHYRRIKVELTLWGRLKAEEEEEEKGEEEIQYFNKLRHICNFVFMRIRSETCCRNLMVTVKFRKSSVCFRSKLRNRRFYLPF